MARMHRRIVEWSQTYTKNDKVDASLKALSSWDLNRFKIESLPAARDYLKKTHKLAAPQ